MARQSSRHPTELEHAILHVLWDRGPSTVREVRNALEPERDLAYTTVMTTLTTMHRKKYVNRSKDGLGYVYRARIKQTATAGRMLQDVIHRAFSGSTSAVVQHLIETSNLEDDELESLRALIDRRVEESENKSDEQ